MRTEAQLAALERDKWLCQWHLRAKHMIVDATDGHHMFGRMNDVPEAIIALCHACHMDIHDGRLSNKEIIKVQFARGILDEQRIWWLERIKRLGRANATGH